MKKHIYIRIRLGQEALMRKRRRHKKIRKCLNRLRKRRTWRERNYRQNVFHSSIYEAVAPQDFSVNNIAGIVNFIRNIDTMCRKNIFKTLKVNLDNVVCIDSFGIALIISMLNRLSFRRIRFWGTYPDDENARQVIIDSGFLEFVKTNLKEPIQRVTGNQLFMIGKDRVDSCCIGKALKTAMANILGKEEAYPPAYDNMMEISSNSVEHANYNRYEKNWLVSISIEGNALHFIMADTGLGILENLRKNNYETIRDWFTKSDADVLYALFNKEYQSITNEDNRHKGLPNVYESFKDGFISDFKVLTNKVLVDFKTSNVTKLRKGYNGVLFSWKVTMDNYNNWLKSYDE